MNGNRFGTIFQVTTWGESHGPSLGAIIDGCPSQLPLSEEHFDSDMLRRQGGKALFTTERKESDRVQIESGVFEGKTTGTPIALRILNETQKSADYEDLRHVARPGHADLTTHLKQGHRDHRGGGRASARETAARVAAGVVAKRILKHYGISMLAWLESAGEDSLSEEQRHECETLALSKLRERAEASELGCPFAVNWAEKMKTAKELGDSWGGGVRCRVEGLPTGVGEPVFDKLGAQLAHALMSLPAAVAFEAGGGLRMSRQPGSAIRDAIAGAPPAPVTNHHGGLLGGITTGLPLLLGVSFHAPTSIRQTIRSVNMESGDGVELSVGGRHDAFPLPRVLPVVEAMVAITLVDMLMRAGRIPEKL